MIEISTNNIMKKANKPHLLIVKREKRLLWQLQSVAKWFGSTLRLNRFWSLVGRLYKAMGGVVGNPADWQDLGKSDKRADEWSIAITICCDLGSSPLQCPALDVFFLLYIGGHRWASVDTTTHVLGTFICFSSLSLLPANSYP